jgi:hypothetical protein
MMTFDGLHALLEKIPEDLPQELSEIYTVVMTVGYPFLWRRAVSGNGLHITGTHNSCIWIFRRTEGWSARFTDRDCSQDIYKGIDKKEVMNAAKQFALKSRKTFSACDADATWAQEKATEKQLEILREWGASSGLESLTKGQVTAIVNSGIFWGKKQFKVFPKFI